MGLLVKTLLFLILDDKQKIFRQQIEICAEECGCWYLFNLKGNFLKAIAFS